MNFHRSAAESPNDYNLAVNRKHHLHHHLQVMRYHFSQLGLSSLSYQLRQLAPFTSPLNSSAKSLSLLWAYFEAQTSVPILIQTWLWRSRADSIDGFRSQCDLSTMAGILIEKHFVVDGYLWWVALWASLNSLQVQAGPLSTRLHTIASWYSGASRSATIICIFAWALGISTFTFMSKWVRSPSWAFPCRCKLGLSPMLTGNSADEQEEAVMGVADGQRYLLGPPTDSLNLCCCHN